MAGMRVLARWRAAVETFPLGGAFPTAAYTARYDSPAASGGRSRSQASPPAWGPRSGGGLPSSATALFLPATACGLRRSFPSSPSRMLSCGLRCTCPPSASATSLCEAGPALQGARSPLRPPGGSVDASSIVCAVIKVTTPPWTPDSLRVGASPYPTGTLTLQETPSLSWRENARHELLPEAVAKCRL
jgi:hypothetical protein